MNSFKSLPTPCPLRPVEQRAEVILQGDCLEILRMLPEQSVNCCVTSPPYWGLRDYGVAGQIGLEPTPEAYVARLVEVFCEVRRVLRDDGTLWLNLGDSYTSMLRSGRRESPGVGAKQEIGRTKTALKWHAGDGSKFQWRIPSFGTDLKPKDLVGIPWRVAFALQADGWWLRSDIIWHKPNPMPESVTDRPTKAHEYLFLLAKSERYYYDAEAIKEPSVTEDMRRPYTSQGAWALDGRPAEQRHGGEPRGKGGKSAFCGQGRERSSDGGPANRDGRKLRDVGAGITRNRRSVWTVATDPYPEAHFATFPPALIVPCIKAGCPAGGTVLDPFAGSGTTLEVARQLGCSAIGIELNPEYCKLAEKRLQQEAFSLYEADLPVVAEAAMSATAGRLLKEEMEEL